MKRFWMDLKKHFGYAKFAAKSDLKSEVANSYLNWLWWILDPLLFMCVYTFLSEIVFGRTVEYFPLYVFVGLSLWQFFNKTVIGSVKCIRNNNPIVSKVYLPKYILILEKMMVNGFKMLVSFALVIVMMIGYRVPLTWNIFFLIPVMLELVVLTFGIACFMLHFGVFIDDLYNIMNVLLRLMFYMSGIFYSISDRLKEPYLTILMKVNPMGMLLQAGRQCLLYSSTPDLKTMAVWGVISVLLCIVGVRTIYKYENSYVKVS